MTYNNNPVVDSWNHLVEDVGIGGIADLVEAVAETPEQAEEIYTYIIDAVLPPEGTS